MDINEIMESIDRLTGELYKENSNLYEKFLKLYPIIKNSYEEFIALLPRLNEIGIDIKSERLLQDMRDISDAIENKDKVLFFDTLKFRVRETLGWYKQIIEIMEEE